MGVNSLPMTVTRRHRGCDLNPGPSAPESSTLTTRHPKNTKSTPTRCFHHVAGQCRHATDTSPAAPPTDVHWTPCDCTSAGLCRRPLLHAASHISATTNKWLSNHSYRLHRSHCKDQSIYLPGCISWCPSASNTWFLRPTVCPPISIVSSVFALPTHRDRYIVFAKWRQYALYLIHQYMFAYGPADAIPKTNHPYPHLNPDWFYLSGTCLPRLSWKRGH